MQKIVFTLILSLLLCHKNQAQTTPKYFPIEIFPNSAKASPASKIFDQCYAIGYNNKGQFLYGYVNTTEAADHDGFSIRLYDAVTRKDKILKSMAMEDSLNVYDNFKQFFNAHKKVINQFITKYKIENKEPTISLITKKDYTLTQKCKTEYDWVNCTYKATYKTEKPFTIIADHSPSKEEKPSLHKLIQFKNHNIILYNTIKRGWEGTPYVVEFGLY
jgi:hypothetical protein